MLGREANSFLIAKLDENSEIQRKMCPKCFHWASEEKYRSKFFKSDLGYFVYYPSNIFRNTRDLENWGLSITWIFVCFTLEAKWVSLKVRNSVQQFFVSVDLIPAAPQVLTLCQCLDLKGEKSSLLFILLGRFYDYSCKYKNVRPSSIEYVNQVRCNFKIEKHVSVITGTQNAEVAQNTPVIITPWSLLWT